MLKKLSLAAIMIVAGAMATTASAQTSQPTKTAPVAGIDTNWKNGLSSQDVQLINRVTRGKGDEDRWMIWTAIVRNREASRDIYPGERLTNDKVLANVRVRMSLDESKRWTDTWSHLSSWDRNAMTRVLRDDLSVKH
jgi:hypothetical protein